MSINTVERILWEFGEHPELIGQFKANPTQYLQPFPLEETEKQALIDVNLKALAELGVSTLLTMMVWPMINGPEGMPFAYLEHMNGHETAASPS